MSPSAKVTKCQIEPRHPWGLILAACLLLLGMAGLAGHALAQNEEAGWEVPVNLSRGGGASEAIIVVQPNGQLRVLWWDQFEGLMVTDGLVPAAILTETVSAETPQPGAGSGEWSEPQVAPILMPVSVMQAGQSVIIPMPVEVMPLIVADTEGRAQAFWLGESLEENGGQPLHYSCLVPNGISWTRPLTMAIPAGAFDATADLSGTLHLAYVQPTQVGNSPSGLYYRRSGDGGASWSAPTVVYSSRYLRLLPAQDGAMCLTAGDANNLSVTWQDPRQGQLLVSQSSDGGATWQEPRPVVASDGVPLGNRVVAVPGGPERVLWPMPGESGSSLAVSSSGDALALALWDGDRWSAATHLDLSLRDPDLGLALSLDALRFAFVSTGSDQEGGTEKLIVVGTDQQGDLWLTSMGVEALAAFLVSPTSSPDEGEAMSVGGVNLSQSGAATDPTIVSGQDGRLHAFWWDQFNGLMLADGVVSASTVMSGTEEVTALHDFWSEPRPVPLPSGTIPWILSDAHGRVHAIWQQAPPPGASGELLMQPYLYSQLTVDGVAWSSPAVLVESALALEVMADTSGALHLAYLVTEQRSMSPAGVYYRQKGAEGAGWSAPALVHASRYTRLLTSDNAHLRLAADETGGIYVTWDDPRQERALLSYSPDGGATWNAPVEIGNVEGDVGSRRARLVTPPGGETFVLWEPWQAGSTCTLVQAPASAVLEGAAGDGQRLLEGMISCPRSEGFLPLSEGQVLMMADSGSEALTLVLWDGERWSEPTHWGTSFEDPATGRNGYLGNLDAALLQVPSPGIGWALAAVGTDGAGDVWATNSQLGSLDLVFAEPSPWSEPVIVSKGQAYPAVPSVATDAQGWLHVLWSEGSLSGEAGTALTYARWDGTAWTSPAAVLRSADGKSDQPALVTVGDRLHAVWSSGQGGEVLYSRAFAGDAHAASGWSEPFPLPSPGEVGSRPHILVSGDGVLHVVYAVPVNEGRGIYHTRSADGGETWDPARQVFDAAAAGWLMADCPQAAADTQGLLHVAWVRSGVPGAGSAQGVYYANSADGGDIWSAPFEIAAGSHAWPQAAAGAPGQVHLVWHESGAQPAWWHRWSSDGGQTWTRQDRVSGFDAVSAPVALLDHDDSGGLYLAGVTEGSGDGPALLLVAWDGQRWGAPETFPLDVRAVMPGAAAGIQPALGSLHMLIRGEMEPGHDSAQRGLWHTARQLPPVAVAVQPAAAGMPLPVLAPGITPTPSPMPSATATPWPTATFDTAPPVVSDITLPMAVGLAGVLATLVVVAGLAWRYLWMGRQTGDSGLVGILPRALRRVWETLRRFFRSIKDGLPRART